MGSVGDMDYENIPNSFFLLYAHRQSPKSCILAWNLVWILEIINRVMQGRINNSTIDIYKVSKLSRAERAIHFWILYLENV